MQMYAKHDDEKWKELIAMADKNGDGMVSLEEFTQSLKDFLDLS